MPGPIFAPPSPEMLARAQRIVDERAAHPPTEEEIMRGGVAFIMGPGGDEGTRQRVDLLAPSGWPSRPHEGSPPPRDDGPKWQGRKRK